jgi:putative transcriptional regulator
MGRLTRYLYSMTNELRQLRESQALSQGQLAQALRVSRQTINAIETGRYLPSLPLAFAIARFFGRHIEEVFHDNEHV